MGDHSDQPVQEAVKTKDESTGFSFGTDLPADPVYARAVRYTFLSLLRAIIAMLYITRSTRMGRI